MITTEITANIYQALTKFFSCYVLGIKGKNLTSQKEKMKEKWTLVKKLKSRGLARWNIKSPEPSLSARETS